MERKGRLLFTIIIAALLFLAFSDKTDAATQLNSYTKLESGQTSSVSTGTIRYVNQSTRYGSQYFYNSYWGANKSIAGIQCNLASVSMALSYMGINKLPANMTAYGAVSTLVSGTGVSISNPSVSTGIDRMSSGGGKYSPVVVYMNRYGTRSSTYEHWVIVVGRVSGNTYQVVDTAYGIGPGFNYNVTINGNTLSAWGKNSTINATYQFYRGTPPPPVTPTLSISPTIAKTSMKVGETCKVGGTVSSTGSNISSVTAGVYRNANGTGGAVGGIEATRKPNSTYYNVANVDAVLYFQNIKEGGTYYYVVKATLANGTTKTASKKFTVQGNQCGQPNISATNINGGKNLKITVGSADTVNYTVKRNGAVVDSGSCAREFNKNYTSAGKYSVSAYATRSGYTKSNTRSSEFNIDKVATPKIIQTATDNHMAVNISSDTAGAALYYTTSGNAPTTSSTRFSGALTLTEQKTIKAIAVKSGMANSDVGEITVKMEEPEAPAGLSLTSADKIPMGESVNVKWNAVYLASAYTVALYKDGSKINEVKTAGTTASFILPEAGKYRINVYASNFVGNSAVSDSPITVEAMEPSKVTFKDWDGSVIKEQEVPYGKDAVLAPEPSRRGYTFLYWSNADKIKNVKDDLELTATYKINTYTVRFLNKSGNQVGPSQKVEYMKSAVSPEKDLDDIPTGYVFAGWKVLQAADDSAGDYKAVDSDMKLQAVYVWFNDELPIVTEIESARQNVKTGNYNVTVKLTNYPKDTTTAILRVSLLTQEGKMVKSSKVEVEVDEDGTTTKAVTLKYSGIATKASAFAVGMDGDDLTSSAYSKEATSEVTVQSNEVWSDWSDWTETKPEEAEKTEIESKTQYHYADKEFSTATSATKDGWIKYKEEKGWNDWGAWSGWSATGQSANDAKQVETRKSYRYYCFLCPKCGRQEPYDGRCDCGKATLTSADVREIWRTTPYSASNSARYPYIYGNTQKRYTTIFDGKKWNFTETYMNVTTPGTLDVWLNKYIIRNEYRYRTRTQKITYHFYRWKDWSNWGETVYTENDNRKVEKRVLYRSRTKVPVYSPLAGKEDPAGSTYHIKGNLSSVTEDLKGKLATIMVYKGKNSDPNEDQIQFVGQTTIGADNAYEFDVIPKTDPTPVTGDFTVCLGVQGSTGLINVDTIRYKRQIFKVTYLDEDGTEISSQEVEEGNNAKAPAGPKKDGSIFTGWSDTATNVQENMTITAMYEPVTYVAAFVDGANGIVSFESYSYGDKLVPPENPTAEGKEFKGWDRILEGRDIVTGHMIVNAVYETNSYTVEFVDDADKVISTQKVEYGKSATPPAALDVTGKEFLGWSTQSEWWYVTEDMTVKPILSCLETVDAPSYYAVANETYVAMYLESATEDAKIYYSLNDASPDADDVSADPELQEYDGGPIILDEFEIEEDVDEDKKEVTLHRTAKVNAVATKESMNDSELAELVYNDTITVPMDVTEATVTFEPNGGSALDEPTRKIEIGETYGELPVPTYSGYDLVGWFTGPEDGAQVEADDVCYKDITLYAQWEKNDDVHVHTVVIDPAVEADCQHTGWTEGSHCSECGETIVARKATPKTDHNWDAGKVTKEATCTEDGTKLYTCTVCGATKITAIEKTGHIEEELPAVEPTCTKPGKTAGTYCSVCGQIIQAQEDVKATGHQFGEWKIVKDATCKEGGLEERICETCGEKETRESEPGEHKEEVRNASKATCLMEGYTGDTYCSVCGEFIKVGTVISKSEHEWGFGKVTEKATCAKEGKKTYSCELCGQKKEESIPVDPDNHTGKTEIRNKKDATTTEAGYTGDTYCADCGVKLKSGKEIPVLPSEDEASIKVQDAAVMAGKEITMPVVISRNPGIAGFSFEIEYDSSVLTLKKIAESGILASEKISTNGNIVNWYGSDNITGDGELLKLTFEIATNASEGETDVKVSPKDGKKNLVDETGSYVDVNYQPGTLNVRRGTPGDVNGDADITIADVVMINRHVLGKQLLLDDVIGYADVNDDGDVTIGDVVIENRHVLGKENLLEALAYFNEVGSELGAGGSMTISVDDANIKSGETFDLPVWVEDNTGVAGMALKFTIPEGYTLNSITAGDLLSEVSFTSDENSCTWYAEKNVTSDGELMTLNLTAPENAKNGTVTVQAKNADGNNLTDEHGVSMLVEYAAGSIVVDGLTKDDKAAADEAIKAINGADPSDPDSVKAARDAYEGLSDKQKELVDSALVQKLEDAEKTVAEVKEQEDKKAADDVIDAINNLNVNDPASVEAARQAYDSLSGEQKKLVDASVLQKLEDAEKTVEAQKQEAKKPKTILVSKIKLTGISTKIAAGKKIKLTAAVLPKNASKPKVKWTSSNKKVATVTQKGWVTIKKKTGGKSVKIIATATDGSKKKAVWSIKVMKGAVTKVTIKGAKKTLKAGKTMKLKASLKKTKGTANTKVLWTSSNKKWATVTQTGKVKALKAGKGKIVKITVMSTDGSNRKAVKKIKIK